MKKLILMLIIVVGFKVQAQTVDYLRDKLNSIFAYVDKSQIPSGYLQEYGTEFTPLHIHSPPFLNRIY